MSNFPKIDDNNNDDFLEFNLISDFKKLLKLTKKNKSNFFKFILGSLLLSAVFIGFKKEKYIGSINLEFYQSSRNLLKDREKLINDLIKNYREMEVESLKNEQTFSGGKVLGFTKEIKNLKLKTLEDNQVSITLEHENKDRLNDLLNLLANQIYFDTNNNLEKIINSQLNEEYFNDLTLIKSYLKDLEKNISEYDELNKKDYEYLKKVKFKDYLKVVMDNIMRDEFTKQLVFTHGKIVQKFGKPEIKSMRTISNFRIICLTVAFGLFLFYLNIFIKEELK